METLTCNQCQGEFPRESRQRPKFCSGACRQKAYRERKSARLADGRRWVRARGKMPLTVDGRAASSTDPDTWSMYGDVRRSRVGDGFGVMLGDGLGCYDFDKCFNELGELEPWASGALALISEKIVFVERSVSGRGLHVFFESEVSGPGRKRVVGNGGVERYVAKRFIRTTLDRVDLKALMG